MRIGNTPRWWHLRYVRPTGRLERVKGLAAMTTAYDAIVIGAGHNGLVTAAYLAKGELKTLVLERREMVAGKRVGEATIRRGRCFPVSNRWCAPCPKA